jgi:protein-disulfide isomerase
MEQEPPLRHAFELAVPVGPADHCLGPADARVTVVEYGDYECPNCKQAVPALKQLLARFHDRVRLVYRHFPLEAVHVHALHAAEAAECAGAQGRFWPMHDLLFEHQDALQPNHLREYAQRLELDMARFNADMRDHLYLQRIRDHIRSGEESGVRATPTFFVDGKLEDVSYGITKLFEAVQRALDR